MPACVQRERERAAAVVHPLSSSQPSSPAHTPPPRTYSQPPPAHESSRLRRSHRHLGLPVPQGREHHLSQQEPRAACFLSLPCSPARPSSTELIHLTTSCPQFTPLQIMKNTQVSGESTSGLSYLLFLRSLSLTMSLRPAQISSLPSASTRPRI